ncbi:cytochrome c oxidase assembly protein COX19 [Kockovaella imperatae]|uniref:Cytochrome c oxidase assembly protein COX19 n=1 Tax=Kockovaella imperatae TaxID=4999 RepID=A0A1Y1U8U2_9TREE|nr:cytochrome c oxidase assembly protein COX19 [Kockovaella imperatae]ORX33964.1 cytochrome c oxidase assembly protein COX19 [Kockovaella imperatae]
MSFGRPGGFADTFKVTPPQRGSFPLDHDGDCKAFMIEHLKCLKEFKGDNGKCRFEARRYLECRMDHDLMDRDDMQNLGLGNATESQTSKAAQVKPQAADVRNGDVKAQPTTVQERI